MAMARDIDNAKTAVPQCNPWSQIESVVVRPTMRNGISHRPDNSLLNRAFYAAITGKESSYAAHELTESQRSTGGSGILARLNGNCLAELAKPLFLRRRKYWLGNPIESYS